MTEFPASAVRTCHFPHSWDLGWMAVLLKQCAHIGKKRRRGKKEREKNSAEQFWSLKEAKSPRNEHLRASEREEKFRQLEGSHLRTSIPS
ncbi:hypothetical protein IRJ41_001190 [Triplophysa rosa]|uniref:Uncharacterized protein n=1 Tax=Triplophysa rosa TaxID=992332 RepID=A0A9W7WBT9_TRIRA|nr:hypothetical protein IRJ41_001190 [Triplophysa rosa]